MSISKYLTLKACASQLGGSIPVSTLRAEVLAGHLKAIRARPGCNAPILVAEVELARWLTEVAGKRVTALSPAEASAVNNAAVRHA